MSLQPQRNTDLGRCKLSWRSWSSIIVWSMVWLLCSRVRIYLIWCIIFALIVQSKAWNLIQTGTSDPNREAPCSHMDNDSLFIICMIQFLLSPYFLARASGAGLASDVIVHTLFMIYMPFGPSTFLLTFSSHLLFFHSADIRVRSWWSGFHMFTRLNFVYMYPANTTLQLLRAYTYPGDPNNWQVCFAWSGLWTRPECHLLYLGHACFVGSSTWWCLWVPQQVNDLYVVFMRGERRVIHRCLNLAQRTHQQAISQLI